MTWAKYLRSQVEAILALDFIGTVTPTGRRRYNFAEPYPERSHRTRSGP